MGLTAVPCPHGPGAHSANVRCQEHDVCSRPAPWTLPHSSSTFPWSYVHERSGRTDAERTKQECLVFCRMDSEQHQGLRVRHSSQGSEDGCGICWQLDCHSRDVQASCRVLHS